MINHITNDINDNCTHYTNRNKKQASQILTENDLVLTQRQG